MNAYVTWRQIAWLTHKAEFQIPILYEQKSLLIGIVTFMAFQSEVANARSLHLIRGSVFSSLLSFFPFFLPLAEHDKEK